MYKFERDLRKILRGPFILPHRSLLLSKYLICHYYTFVRSWEVSQIFVSPSPPLSMCEVSNHIDSRDLGSRKVWLISHDPFVP